MNNLKKISSVTKIFILAFFLSVGVGIIFAQWTNPSGPFPADQPPAPVNVGSSSQTKTGSFWAGFLGSDGAGYFSSDLEVNGKITIKGGDPRTGKILSSENSEGLASWVNLPPISCQIRQTVSNATQISTAPSCLSGEVLISGGGNCGNARLNASYPLNENTWRVVCDAVGTVTSYAFCCGLAEVASF